MFAPQIEIFYSSLRKSVDFNADIKTIFLKVSQM